MTAEGAVLDRIQEDAVFDYALPSVADQAEAYLQSLTAQVQPEAVNGLIIESRPADMYPEVEAVARRDVLGLITGAIALRNSVEKDETKAAANSLQTEEKHGDSVTLLDMLRGNAAGDSEMKAAATENVRTMVREVTKKYQSVSRVTGHIDDNGHFWQYGQSSRHYLMNTFAFLEVNKTSKDEAHGMLRFEELVRRGLLTPGETYWEISLVPEGERQKLAETGYFLESMSYAIRGLTLDKDGRTVDVEVAFVAGVDQGLVCEEVGDDMSEAGVAARQEQAIKMRHDIALLKHLQQRKALNFEIDSESNIQSFITAHGATPHGVVDIVRLCDDIAGEMLGKELFFGVAQSREDYASFPQKCEEQMARFDGLVQDVLRIATEYVTRGEITNPADGPPLMRKILAELLVPRAVEERDFDIRVLGASAAQLLVDAQRAADAGNTEAANKLVAKAKKVAAVDDCPTSRKRAEQDGNDTENEDSDGDEESDEDCDIKTFCPHCSDLNHDGSPSLFRILVTARIDSTKTVHCGRCHAYAGPSGSSEGFIKPLAQLREKVQKTKQVVAGANDD